MLWVKAFHIIFVISWYAGLLYLPRLFVYHADCEDEPGKERFKVMERRLFGIMTIGLVGSLALGLWLLHAYALQAYASTIWLWVKLVLAAVLIVFHGYCLKWMRAFREESNQRSARFYRMINEIPALIMIVIVVGVVVKPA